MSQITTGLSNFNPHSNTFFSAKRKGKLGCDE